MILVTGATGNVGRELIRALVGAGQVVRALIRRDADRSTLPAGAEGVVGDLDRPETLSAALVGVRAVHLLSGYRDMPVLLAEARSAGVEHVVLQSSSTAPDGDMGNAVARYHILSEQAVRESGLPWTFLQPNSFMSNTLQWVPQLRDGDVVHAPFADVNHRYAREGGPVKSEDDPLDPKPVAAMRASVAAMDYVDKAVTGAGGIALRYGIFYGDPDDGLVEAVRARKFPVVGDGAGVWSFIHLDDAASATVLALELSDTDWGPAVYNIVDDEPAPTGEWLPELARIVGAKPPQRLPRPLARLFAGEAPVVMATESRGASNAKAKRELGWTLRYPSWRQGFADLYAEPAAATSTPRSVPANAERVGSSSR